VSYVLESLVLLELCLVSTTTACGLCQELLHLLQLLILGQRLQGGQHTRVHDISGTLRIQPFCSNLHTYWLWLLFDLNLRPLLLWTLGLILLKRTPTRVLHRLQCLSGVHRLLLQIIFGSIEGRLLSGLGRSPI